MPRVTPCYELNKGFRREENEKTVEMMGQKYISPSWDVIAKKFEADLRNLEATVAPLLDQVRANRNGQYKTCYLPTVKSSDPTPADLRADVPGKDSVPHKGYASRLKRRLPSSLLKASDRRTSLPAA